MNEHYRRLGRLTVLRTLDRLTRHGNNSATTAQVRDGLGDRTLATVYACLLRLEGEGLAASFRDGLVRRWSLSPQGRLLVEALTGNTE
jgi:hypothetical protein